MNIQLIKKNKKKDIKIKKEENAVIYFGNSNGKNILKNYPRITLQIKSDKINDGCLFNLFYDENYNEMIIQFNENGDHKFHKVKARNNWFECSITRSIKSDKFNIDKIFPNRPKPCLFIVQNLKKKLILKFI